jgi:hypothetical protein
MAGVALGRSWASDLFADERDRRGRAIDHGEPHRLLVSREVSDDNGDTIVVQRKDVRSPVTAVSRAHTGVPVDDNPDRGVGVSGRRFVNHGSRLALGHLRIPIFATPVVKSL